MLLPIFAQNFKRAADTWQHSESQSRVALAGSIRRNPQHVSEDLPSLHVHLFGALRGKHSAPGRTCVSGFSSTLLGNLARLIVRSRVQLVVLGYLC
jgi:hypothetical protein